MSTTPGVAGSERDFEAMERRSLELLRSAALRRSQRPAVLAAIRALWSPMTEDTWTHWSERLRVLDSELAAEIFASVVLDARGMPSVVAETLSSLALRAREQDRNELASTYYVALARAHRIEVIDPEAMMWFGNALMREHKASWAEELAREWLARPREGAAPVADFLNVANDAVRAFVRGRDHKARGRRPVARPASSTATPESSAGVDRVGREDRWVDVVLGGWKPKLDD